MLATLFTLLKICIDVQKRGEKDRLVLNSALA
jgi:hypothetical protein